MWRSSLADLVLPHYFLYFVEQRVDQPQNDAVRRLQRDQCLQIQLIPGSRSVCLRLCQFLHALILPVSLWHPSLKSDLSVEKYLVFVHLAS